jgi:hypothetical protein
LGQFCGGGGGGGGGGAGSSFAASVTPICVLDLTRSPKIVISWTAPTLAAAAGLHVAIAGGWTTLSWRSTTNVLGFNVYRGSHKLNRILVTSTSQRYTFHVHAVVPHPVLRAVPSH